jgi:hypothetical protein
MKINSSDTGQDPRKKISESLLNVDLYLFKPYLFKSTNDNSIKLPKALI